MEEDQYAVLKKMVWINTQLLMVVLILATYMFWTNIIGNTVIKIAGLLVISLLFLLGWYKWTKKVDKLI